MLCLHAYRLCVQPLQSLQLSLRYVQQVLRLVYFRLLIQALLRLVLYARWLQRSSAHRKNRLSLLTTVNLKGNRLHLLVSSIVRPHLAGLVLFFKLPCLRSHLHDLSPSLLQPTYVVIQVADDRFQNLYLLFFGAVFPIAQLAIEPLSHHPPGILNKLLVELFFIPD